MVNEVKLKLAIEGGRVVGAEIDGVSASLDKLGQQSSSAQGKMSSVAGTFGSLSNSSVAAAAGLGRLNSHLETLVTVGAAMALIKMADAATTLQTQLRLSSSSTSEAKRAYTELFDIAQQGRVSFTELGTTYAAIARSGQQLGITQSRLLDVTKSISQAMTIGGGSAASMQAALVQLGQGLSSGTLRGEELNSIMEQTPRLAKAIADGLGVPIGELRKLGETGQLTSQQVISALEKAGPALAKEMESATLTVGQSFTMLSNSAVKFMGDADQATGTTSSLASALKNLSGTLDMLGSTINQHETAFAVIIYGLAGAAAISGISGLAAAISTRLVPALLAASAAAGPIGLITLAIGAIGGAAVAAGNAWATSAEGMRVSAAKMTNEIAAIDTALANGLNGRGYKASADDRAEMQSRRQFLAEKKALLAQEIALSSSSSLDTRAEDARLARQTSAFKQAEKDAKTIADLLAKSTDVPESYIKRMREIGEANATGAMTADQLATALDAAHGLLKKNTAGQKEHNKEVEAAKQALGLYNDLVDQASGYSKTYAEDQNKLALALKNGSISYSQYTDAVLKLMAQQPQMVEQQKAAIKADEDGFKAMQNLREANEKQIKTAADYLAQLEFEIKLLGMGTEQRALATAERELERQGIIAGTAAYDQYIERIRTAVSGKIAAEASIDAAKKSAEAWQDGWKATDTLARSSFTDWAKRGSSAAEQIGDSLQTALLSAIYEATIRPIAFQIYATTASALGLGSAASATSAVSGASSASNLFGAGSFASSSFAMGMEGTVATIAEQGFISGFSNAMTSAATLAKAGSFTGALGAAMPYIGAAIAAATVLQNLGVFGSNFISATDSGRARIDYSSTGTGGAAYSTTGTADQSATAAKSVEALAQSYFKTAATLGIQAMQATFEVGYNTGKEGASPQTVLGVNIGSASYSSGEIASGDQSAMSLAASRAVLTALKASELPTYLKSVFDDLTVGTATQDQINAALQFAQSLKSVRDSLTETRTPLQVVKDSAASAMTALGTAAATFKTDFVAAIDKGISADKLAQWQALGQWLDQAADAAAKLAETNKTWQDKLDVLNGKTTNTQIERQKQLAEATDDSTKALMRAVFAAEDYKAAQEAAMKAVTNAVSAEKEAITTAYEDQADRIQKALDPIGESIGKLQSLSDTLKTSLNGMKLSGSDGQARAEAQAQIAAALAIARAGGPLPLDGQLNNAINTVTQPSDKLYGDFISYAKDFYRTAADINALSDLTGAQLTEQETTQKLLQDQLDNAKAEFDSHVQYLDKQVDLAQKAVDAANGTSTAVLGVDQTLQALYALLATSSTSNPSGLAAADYGSMDGYSRYIPGSPTSTIDYSGTPVAGARYTQYVRLPGYGTSGIGITDPEEVARLDSIASALAQYSWAPADVAASATAIYQAAMASGATLQEIANAAGYEYSDVAALFSAAGIPSFFQGTNRTKEGLAYLHDDEAVVPAAYNPAIGNGVVINNGGPSYAEVVSELKAMRGVLHSIKATNDAIAMASRNTDKTLQGVTRGGTSVYMKSADLTT